VTSVLVANLSAPEIARLGVELEHRGALRRYIRPYVNKGRLWERLIEHAPGLGRTYRRTLGRRAPPPGLPMRKVVEAGVVRDFAAAAVARLPFGSGDWRHTASRSLMFAAEREVARVAGRYMQILQTDIVVASYGTGRFAFEVARRTGAEAVLSYAIAHNRFQQKLYEEESQLEPEFAAALPRIGQLPAEYSERLDAECELAHRIIVGSNFVRDSFVTEGYDARKIVVTPYGVDTERFTPRVRPRNDGTFRALFVGQIGQRKGMSYLLKGYELFRRPDSELHIVGDPVAGAEVFGPFRHLYRHTTHVPQRDLPAMFHDADVFVFPSLIEGMPLVVLEAMACGLPIITTRNGPGEILRDGVDGFFVPIRDPEAIALRLEQLYRDRGLLEQMSKNAREQALRHTWNTYACRAADAVLGNRQPSAHELQCHDGVVDVLR
jgi:glycosyltransferase involved in cell wall biosynthesis